MTEEKNNKRSIKTWYNRFEQMTLFHIYHILKEGYEIDGEAELKDKRVSFDNINAVTEEKLKFGEDALAIHLRSLYKRGLIDIIGIGEDLDIENIKDKEIELTATGRKVAYLLKDIKFQSIYRNRKFNKDSEPRYVDQHSKTFYNRHSLSIVMKILNNSIAEYKEDGNERGFEELNFDDYVFSLYTMADLNEMVHYSEDSLSLHLKYLLKKELLSESDDGYRLTDFGLLVARILKDIKYQSLYNIGKAKLKKG